MTSENILFALGLTLFAGLSTGIGSALAFFTKRTNKKVLSIALGFSAGVMIYISFVEIFFKGQDLLVQSFGEKKGVIINVISFFTGILVIALIDKLIHMLGIENPHEDMQVEDLENPEKRADYKALYKTGLITASAIAIHNFPEGLATFFSALQDPKMGIAIAMAVAIHNIPEGIAVSVPIYYATGSKKKAFFYSFLSGLSEPIGGLIGYFFLAQFMSDTLTGCIFAAVAGIMVFISIDQLLPAAREYGEHHLSIYGLILGMAVMALSLILFI